MGATDNTTTSSSFPPPPQPPLPAVLGPCAACKILRRRCTDDCLLAPYFPPTEPHNFLAVHRVFGASNIIKLLQELPERHRADAVSSMVYEASCRIRSPVYGCTGAIFQLHNQVNQLQTQLAQSRAELADMHNQRANANLLAAACMEMAAGSHQHVPQPLDTSFVNSPDQIFLQTEGSPLLLDYDNQSSMWDQLCGHEDSTCPLPHSRTCLPNEVWGPHH